MTLPAVGVASGSRSGRLPSPTGGASFSALAISYRTRSSLPRPTRGGAARTSRHRRSRRASPPRASPPRLTAPSARLWRNHLRGVLTLRLPASWAECALRRRSRRGVPSPSRRPQRTSRVRHVDVAVPDPFRPPPADGLMMLPASAAVHTAEGPPRAKGRYAGGQRQPDARVNRHFWRSVGAGLAAERADVEVREDVRARENRQGYAAAGRDREKLATPGRSG